jgi:hypothetical protein
LHNGWSNTGLPGNVFLDNENPSPAANPHSNLLYVYGR